MSSDKGGHPTAVVFSDKALELVQKIIKRYPEGRQKSALLPVLHLAQAEFGGWLSVPVMDYVASLLLIEPIEVYEVASFYTMYNLQPVGKCVLEVCHTSPCALMGANDIIQYLQTKLKIKPGETTPDGMFTLKTVECLAACGYAPVMQIGQTYHEKLTCDSVDQLLDHYRNTITQPISHWSKEHI
jgi:NADH-quinone oxidoreductase subunit E